MICVLSIDKSAMEFSFWRKSLQILYVLLIACFLLPLGCKDTYAPPSCSIGFQKSPTCLACSPDGHIAITGGHDGSLNIWNISQRKLLRTIGELGNIKAAAYSQSGTTMALCNSYVGDGGFRVVFRVLDTATWKELHTFSTKSAITFLAYAQNDRVLVASGPLGKVQLRDASNGKELAILPAHKNPASITALAVSPEKDILALGDYYGRASIWNLNAKREQFVLEHPRLIESLAFSPDGNILAAAGTVGTFTLWDVTNGKELASWIGHEGVTVKVIAFISDKYLVSSAFDRRIMIWDISTQKMLYYCETDPHSSVYHLAYCPATRKLVLVSGIGYVMVLTPPAELWGKADETKEVKDDSCIWRRGK